jgi:hypothetical protein
MTIGTMNKLQLFQSNKKKLKSENPSSTKENYCLKDRCPHHADIRRRSWAETAGGTDRVALSTQYVSKKYNLPAGKGHQVTNCCTSQTKDKSDQRTSEAVDRFFQFMVFFLF